MSATWNHDADPGTSAQTTDARAVLAMLRDRLHARGVQATGPFPGYPSPEFDYLELPGRRRVLALRDRDGHWQAHVYQGRDLVRMADVDAGDWPGDPVAVGRNSARVRVTPESGQAALTRWSGGGSSLSTT